MLSNDINQGREGARDVPESDQWDDTFRMPKIPKAWMPENYHKMMVMKEENGRGVAREIQDELFLTRQCKGGCPNPHDGIVQGSRYSFNFPANWYGQPAVNKAVALRRIDVSPKSYVFALRFKITRNSDNKVIQPHVFINISPNQTIWEILGVLAFKLTERIKIMGDAIGGNWIQSIAAYNDDTNTATLAFLPVTAAAKFKCELVNLAEPDRVNPQAGFFRLMNVRDPTPYFAVIDTWDFTNVWNRRDLYILASFVNHTAFNYLGKGGDFYMQPNKMYNAESIGQTFYLQVSFDGMTPVELPFEDFDVELSLVVDTKTVQSF
jgi:hypothetical protein